MIHKYDKDTKEYIGSIPKELDPLESLVKGKSIFVIPPFFTDVQPPIPEDGKALVFNENTKEWVQKEDHRGKVIYSIESKEPMVITSLGECPEGYTFEKPLEVKEIKEVKRKEIIDQYVIAHGSHIKINNMKVKITDNSLIKKNLLLAQDHATVPFDQEDGETVFVNEETLELALKTLYIRSMLLAQRKQELLSKLKRLRDKEKIANFEVEYNIDKETKKLVALSDEELDNYFAGE